MHQLFFWLVNKCLHHVNKSSPLALRCCYGRKFSEGTAAVIQWPRMCSVSVMCLRLWCQGSATLKCNHNNRFLKEEILVYNNLFILITELYTLILTCFPVQMHLQLPQLWRLHLWKLWAAGRCCRGHVLQNAHKRPENWCACCSGLPHFLIFKCNFLIQTSVLNEVAETCSSVQHLTDKRRYQDPVDLLKLTSTPWRAHLEPDLVRSSRVGRPGKITTYPAVFVGVWL